MDLQRVKRELDAEIRKAGFLNVAEDKTDPVQCRGHRQEGRALGSLERELQRMV